MNGCSPQDLRPLAGIRVVDLSRLLPGPLCSQILVDLGAEVIKVEDEVGDYIRYFQPKTGDGSSVAFHAVNRGKKSIKLNLKNSQDNKLFLKLLQTADVLLESFRPGTLAKLGLAPEFLIEKFPQLIICSISGFGQTGPHAQRAGHDVGFLARTGALDMMAKPDLLPVQVADIAGGSLPAAIQICAALFKREKTGKGAIIDVSIVDHAAALLMPLAYADFSALGRTMPRGKSILAGGLPGYRVYEAANNTYLAVGTLERKFWNTFVEAIGAGELKDKNEDTKSADLLASLLKSKTAQEWMRTLELKGVVDNACVEPVCSVRDLADDPQIRSRNLFIELTIPASGEAAAAPDQSLKVLGSPFHMSGTSPAQQPGPQLGQHNDEILGSLRMEQSLGRSML